MGTQLILLVGTNPLPVWVAEQYLQKQLKQTLAVWLVYTESTRDEVDRLQAAFRSELSPSLLRLIETSPGEPATIRKDVRIIFNELPPETTDIHVHYTGGTKVMAVETVAAVEQAVKQYQEEFKQAIRIDTSYLDPRTKSGPVLVNREGKSLVKDTRQDIAPDISQIARLNGFVTGRFIYQYERDGKLEKSECPTPRLLSKDQMQAGRAVLTEVSKGKWHNFDITFANSRQWSVAFPQDPNTPFMHPAHSGTLVLPQGADTWRQRLLPVLNAMCPQCPWDITAGTLSYTARDAASPKEKQDLEHMHRFFKGVWLEYAAYDSLRQALEGSAKQNNTRKNYQLFHGVHIRRTESPHRRRPTQHGDFIKPFELDVVAVLGYQLLVVSCSVSIREADIKHKAMEGIIRARQLGGDEARAIVLCRIKKDVADTIQAEVEDEMGSEALPLQIWGENRWRTLPEDFRTYLSNKLYWR